MLLGRHLLARGLRPGPEVGRLLAEAFEAQLDGEFHDSAGAEKWLDGHRVGDSRHPAAIDEPPVAQTKAVAQSSKPMFSHVVIFWTDLANPQAPDHLIAGCHEYLKTIPGLTLFHVGKMVGSHRDVVDQTYQVALNLVFADKRTQDEYQVHPRHLEFVAQNRKFWSRVVVYDFAGPV